MTSITLSSIAPALLQKHPTRNPEKNAPCRIVGSSKGESSTRNDDNTQNKSKSRFRFAEKCRISVKNKLQEMNISFHAVYVHCSNALDWEIQEVIFDTIDNDADDFEDHRSSPYVLISQNFEFPGPATIE